LLHTSHINVDLSAVEENVRVLREALARPDGENPRLCAVIKADAYGLGSVRIAHRLEKKVDMFAVYTLTEAIELLSASVRTPILVMSPVYSIADSDTLYRAVSHGRLHFSVHALDQALALAKQADRFGVEIPVHLDVNTGINRGAAAPPEAAEILEFTRGHRRLIVAGVSSHFADASRDDALTRKQSARFRDWLREMGDRVPPKAILHEANTFGLFRSSTTHLSMTRIGYALAGYACEEFADPENFQHRAHAERLVPAVRWVSAIAHTQWIDAGERVGYGGDWTAQRRTRLALVPVGYADGYPFALSGKGRVRVETSENALIEAPVVGRVSMDQITVDITDLPASAAGVGSEVELIASDRDAPNHLPALAKLAGTISHEILCGLGKRVPRRYLSQREPATPVVVARPATPTAHA